MASRGECSATPKPLLVNGIEISLIDFPTSVASYLEPRALFTASRRERQEAVLRVYDVVHEMASQGVEEALADQLLAYGREKFGMRPRTFVPVLLRITIGYYDEAVAAQDDEEVQERLNKLAANRLSRDAQAIAHLQFHRIPPDDARRLLKFGGQGLDTWSRSFEVHVEAAERDRGARARKGRSPPPRGITLKPLPQALDSEGSYQLAIVRCAEDGSTAIEAFPLGPLPQFRSGREVGRLRLRVEDLLASAIPAMPPKASRPRAPWMAGSERRAQRDGH